MTGRSGPPPAGFRSSSRSVEYPLDSANPDRLWPFKEALRILDSYKVLGSRTLDNGTQLIGPAPHVAPEAWLHLVFPPLTPDQVGELESKIGIRFPDDLRAFFAITNGVGVFCDSLCVGGRRTSYVRQGDAVWQPFDIVNPNTKERPRFLHRDEIRLGSYKWDGSIICINPSGEVMRLPRSNRQVLNRWTSFNSWFVTEVQRLVQLFDDRGRLKHPELITTPPEN